MKPYLERKAPNQKLSFAQLKVAFKKAELKEDDITKILEKLVDFVENYNNLAYILSDQNPHTVKFAKFDKDFNVVEKKEFEGSLFQQYADIYSFLEDYQKDYPSFIFREAIGNALLHRDYAYTGSTLIHIYPTYLEITSVGGVIDGFKTNDVLNGICVLRNKKLSEIFVIMGLGEGYGLGIKRMQSVYANYDKTIDISSTMNSFKITVPDIHKCKMKVDRRILTNKERRILDLLDEFDEISELELQEKMNIKQSRSYLLTKNLAEKGYIEILGRGNTRRYKRKEEED